MLQHMPFGEVMRMTLLGNHERISAARALEIGLVTEVVPVADLATTAQTMYDMYTTDLRQDIGRIKQPVLVFGTWTAYQQYGATKASTLAIFTQQYAKLPQARIEMSEAGRHFLMYDDAAWLLAQTDAFLKQHPIAKK